MFVLPKNALHRGQECVESYNVGTQRAIGEHKRKGVNTATKKKVKTLAEPMD